ncbi:unnamed protein product [Peniophora sp. CBMAI 1063]|nr:unnamed protein product [Peniophora sp. CBMAI 1063]
MTDVQSAEPASERTPLLADNEARTASASPMHAGARPPVSVAVDHVKTHGLDDLNTALSMITHVDDIEKAAYELIVLLQLNALARRPVHVSRKKDVWETWSDETRDVVDKYQYETQALNAWATFSSQPRTTLELETCLWTPFPLEIGSAKMIRVVDMLADRDAPSLLLTDSLIIMSYLHTWKYGWAANPAPTTAKRISQIVTSFASPRIMHAVDLLLHVIYLILLAHYLLWPPPRPVLSNLYLTIGLRGILITIYAVATVCRLSTNVIPSFLVAFAFLATLPSAPYPGGFAYAILLAAFILHILLLHTPRTPTPFLLFKPDFVLPLAELLNGEFTHTVQPAFLFWVPGLLVTLYLLSVSLVDDLPWLPPMHMNGGTPFVKIMASPMETRQAFLALAIIMLVLILFSTVVTVLYGATLRAAMHTPVEAWERYSKPVGARARQRFIAALALYASPHVFPAPFNLLQLVLVHIPVTVLHLRGPRELQIARTLEAISWWATVGVCGTAIAVVWKSVPRRPYWARCIVFCTDDAVIYKWPASKTGPTSSGFEDTKNNHRLF